MHHSSEILQLDVCILNKKLKQHIELFQAGRTKSCSPIWRSLTSDHEILATASGLPIELERDILLESRTHNCSQVQQEIIDIETQKLLKKKVVVSCDHEEGKIISPTFLKEKPDDSFRFILNLKKLNKDITKIYFKMDTIMSILKLVTPLTYFTKIDLKDVYYAIPVSPSHQKYLKFANNHDLYKFTCLPNGYCHGPRKFTKVLKPPLSTLRLDNITIAAYLDDCINMNPSLNQCRENTQKIIKLFQTLGFTVHSEPKSNFTPTQRIEFLGSLDSVTMTITLNNNKKRKLKILCANPLSGVTTNGTISQVLGKITSSFPATKFGRLHYRNLDVFKTSALKYH